MKSKLAEDLGRLFEVGFNIGIVAHIHQNQIEHQFGSLYVRDLQQLKFSHMLKQIVDKLVSPVERQMAEKWGIFFLQKGFLAGLNFFREYIQSTGWSDQQKLQHLEILYYQCSFSNDNSIGTHIKDNNQWYKEVLSQFGQVDGSQYIERYKRKGEFLRADTLMLLRCRKQWRVLCIDLSVFSVSSGEDVKDLNYIEVVRRLLMWEIHYLRSKSVFSNLCLDTGPLDLPFSEDLKNYFTAFKYEDKESAKLIQAASYAYSFYEFLRETDILPNAASVVFNALGHSDRGISAMSIRPENLAILKTCHQIYQQDSSPQEIGAARRQVLMRIKRSAYGSFAEGKKFVDALLAIPADETTVVHHRERLDGFFNSIGEVPQKLMLQLGLSETLNLRQAHAELIKTSLIGSATYIFLTGNPGIGKTTAIANFLKSRMDEGFLFFYVSPRKQVNLDIIDKFKDSKTDLLCDRRLLCLNTHMDLIADNLGHYTVQYLCNERQGDFREQGVKFLDARVDVERRVRRSKRLKRVAENQIRDVGQRTRGVLNSICEAISTAIDCKISNNIVATVAIQSLKKTETGDTLRYIEKIFRNAYNEREGTVVFAEMKDISSRIKHLFIMIDEITGDEGGVEFLNGVRNILSKYKLTDPQYGFNTKIIVADASIIDPDVIEKHLSETSPESNKIFFRKARGNSQPLSLESFKFKGLEAIIINANSYPASSLTINYKIIVESYKFSAEARLERKNSLIKSLQGEISRDIDALLSRSEQSIVYIQNKQRLADLIERIRKHRGSFEKSKDYLELHADVSEEEKEQIQRLKNNVKIIFMTASGSRGLSFPKVKYILAEIPQFEIEKNLMEIIQVIYRGRGEYEEDGVWKTLDNKDKELYFYLSDCSVYYDDCPQLSSQEGVLGLLNILLLLKAAIMTRIVGSAPIGHNNFIIIPIGGKFVSTAHETFSSQMASLVKKLKNEHKRNKADQRLKQIYTSLEQLLCRAKFTLNSTSNKKASSYLAIRKNFSQNFSQLVNNGLDGLLNFGHIEPGYISGSLLVVPIADKSVVETYEMPLSQIIRAYDDGELLKKMLFISHSHSYPESLRSAIKNAVELMDLLQPVNMTQNFEQNTQRFDQYYALPLFAFITGVPMSEYFDSDHEEPEEERFRDILATYIRCLYPVGNLLPIGHKYRDFPFVVFTSYSLEEMRNKMFTDKYLLTSNELNVLNLILAENT